MAFSFPYKIALAGGSGSGKGTLASLLAERGIATLDTDALVHRLYDTPGGSLPRALSREFGRGILRGEVVDRDKLRALVFSRGGEENLARLNSIVHAAVREKTGDFFSHERARGARVCAVDAPQLFEAGMEGDFDLVAALDAPLELRISRILARDGISREEAEERLRHQLPPAVVRRRADVVLANDKDIASLRAQLDALLSRVARDIARAAD